MSSLIRATLAALLFFPLAARGAEKSGSPAGGEVTPPPPATVGGRPAEAPKPPAKAVEEPVFRLPELVIIGENQARIMAQKESLTGSPLKGLHEAPLLEKEESSVTALRQREPALVARPTRTGTGVAVRIEGGTDGWVGGGVWAGRQTDHSTIGVDLDASTLKGEPVGTGHAGGWQAGAAVSGGWTGDTPRWLSWLSLGADPDLVHASAGWREQWRDLPVAGPDARRRLTRLGVSGDASRAAWSTEERLEVVHLRTPVRSVGAAGLRANGSLHVWGNGPVAVEFAGRGEGELADAAGDHLLAGGTLEASYIPADRWRYQAGIRMEGVFGGRVFAGSLRPVGGAAWTTPLGPTVTAVFSPSLEAPWVSREAGESPYSFFRARLVPERCLADLEVAGTHEVWDGSSARVAYRVTNVRDALTWGEAPGTGLFFPAALSRLRVGEFGVNGRYAGLRPFAIDAGARWRAVGATGGHVANLARAEGRGGLEWSWRTITARADVEVVRSRSRGIGGGTLDPFATLGLGLSWVPKPRLEVRLRGSNLNGADVERWAGYPEPRRFVSLGAVAAF